MVSVPSVTWPNRNSRAVVSGGIALSQKRFGANCERSSAFSDCCRRKIPGHSVPKSRPIPANGFPEPGNTNATLPLRPIGYGLKNTRSRIAGRKSPAFGSGIAVSGRAVMARTANAICSFNSAVERAMSVTASFRRTSAGTRRNQSRARISIVRTPSGSHVVRRPRPSISSAVVSPSMANTASRRAPSGCWRSTSCGLPAFSSACSSSTA